MEILPHPRLQVFFVNSRLAIPFHSESFAESFSFFFFFIYLFYLFIFGCVGSSLLRACFLQLRRAGATRRCGALASHCGASSCYGAWALGTRASVVVARGLQSAGPVVVAHGLHCPAACGNLPDQGLNPRRLHWQANS